MAEELVRYYVRRLEDIVAQRRVLKAFHPDLPEEEIRRTLLQTSPEIHTLRTEIEADKKFAEQILELLSNLCRRTSAWRCSSARSSSRS